MREILDFLAQLHDNNTREWFDAHRKEWASVKAQVAALTEELIEGIASFDASVRGLRVQDCTYRIARDTRFSNDKSPYKNWIGIFVAPHGKKSGYAGYYLHIAPKGDKLVGEHMLISGIYCPESVLLRSVREEILDHGAEMVGAIEAARGFRLNTDNKLKRAPVGFPADSEYVELLKHKDWCIEQKIDEKFLLADRFVDRAVAEFRKTHPFIELLNRAVQYAYEEMM
ncbi:MAG: DUF2461 domain-containing protein [Alistipes sp.]|nr:DUF2461 domain-containing protein [Alistipes senegalensis]MCM1250400.1 DUF2461 domain-containing protein [Alistipes sp.]